MTRDEILDRLRERIVGFAASRIQRDAAQDVAQEVLIVLHEKYRHLERMEDLVPPAFEILRFKMIALRRKAVRRGEYAPGNGVRLSRYGPEKPRTSLPSPTPDYSCASRGCAR